MKGVFLSLVFASVLGNSTTIAATSTPAPSVYYSWADANLYPTTIFGNMSTAQQKVRVEHLLGYETIVNQQPDPNAYHQQYVQAYDGFGKGFIANPVERVQDMVGANYTDRAAVANLMHTFTNDCMARGTMGVNSRCTDVMGPKVAENFGLFRKHGATIAQAADFTQQSFYQSKFDKNTFVTWKKDGFSVTEAANFATREKAGELSFAGFQSDLQKLGRQTGNGQFAANWPKATILYGQLTRKITLASRPYNPNGTFTVDDFGATYKDLNTKLGSQKFAFLAAEEIHTIIFNVIAVSPRTRS